MKNNAKKEENENAKKTISYRIPPWLRATMHQLRHSLHTHLRGQGVPDDVLCWMFGWSMRQSDSGPVSRVQEGYTHRELYDLTGAIGAVNALD